MAAPEPETAAPFPPSERRALEAVLAELSEADGIHGATIIDRLGTPLVSHGNANQDLRLMFALAGTLAGAGHAAIAALEPDPDVRVVARSDRTRIHIAGIDQRHLLVTVADNTKPWPKFRPRVNKARRVLRQRIALMEPRHEP